MDYQVIARKWRPGTFSDVVGQQHVLRTLSNSIQQNMVAHAYIFSGARGVGKTTTARILAKALNCAKGPTAEPCGECDSCREITAGNSLDVIEIDAASNRGIDQVRELRDMVRYAPAGGRYKVVILDEAHMLTTEASNALLKTLEEPPDRVVFVMATTEPENLEETIRSRSQHFHFRALSFSEIADALNGIAKKESLDMEPGAVAVIARAADGSLRDALSLLEQARAYCGAKITEAQLRELLGVVPGEVLDELVAAIEQRSADRALVLVHRLLAEGKSLQQFCREATAHFRNLLVVRVCGTNSDLVAAPTEERPRLEQAAAHFTEEDLTRFFDILLATEEDLRRKPDPRLHLEMGMLRLVNAARLAPLEEVLAELSGNSAARPAVRPTTNPTASERTVSAGPPAPVRPTMATPAPEVKPTTPPAADLRAQVAAAAAASAAAKAVAAKPDSAPVAKEPAARPPQTAAAPSAAAESVPTALLTGIDGAQVEDIKSSALSQQRFLGELVDQVSRWEVDGGEIRLYFPTEKRALADLLQSREPVEKLRTIANRVLGRPLRVCVKLEAGPVLGTVVRREDTGRELRARFEQDPIVRAMLERFGGRVSDVKKPGEE